MLNAIFILLTAGLMFLMAWRLFDERVAWITPVAFLASEFVWNYSLLAVPVNLLMFLTTLLFFGAVEVYRIAEEGFRTTRKCSARLGVAHRAGPRRPARR